MIHYSIIIPAYNEEEFLQDTLNIVFTAMKSVSVEGEVIVVDNNSTDRTAEIAKSMGVVLVFEKVNMIARARNAGVVHAQGQYLIFLDADTEITSSLIEASLINLSRGDCCGGGCEVAVDSRGKPSIKWVLSTINSFGKRFNFAAGCYMYCLKEAFDAVGGFNEKIYFSEEIWFMRRIKKWGKKNNKSFMYIADQSVKTSSRKMDYPIKLFFTFFIAFIFPFAPYFKFLGGFWYKRLPRKSEYY